MMYTELYVRVANISMAGCVIVVWILPLYLQFIEWILELIWRWCSFSFLYRLLFFKILHLFLRRRGLFFRVSIRITNIFRSFLQIEIDKTSWNVDNFAFNKVYVTANIKGEPVRFSSKSSLNIMDLPSTGQSIANQIWRYWNDPAVQKPKWPFYLCVQWYRQQTLNRCIN